MAKKRASKTNQNGHNGKYDNKQKVFVKNLPNIDNLDEVLRKQFNPCGNILNVKTWSRKEATNELTEGIVVFSSEEEADQATQQTGSVVEGKHLIAYKYQQFAVPTSNTVFVSNLCPETTDEDLWQFFENCGPIKYTCVICKSSKAEVHFKDEEAVNEAVKHTGKVLRGNVISVAVKNANKRKFDEKASELLKKFPGKVAVEYKYTNPVFIAGISRATSHEDIFFKFQKCGAYEKITFVPTSCDVLKKCVIEFKEAESIRKALALEGIALHGHKLVLSDKKDIFFEYANIVALKKPAGQSSKHEKEQKYTNPLYVAGIPQVAKDVDLFYKFQQCGPYENITFVDTPNRFLKKCVVEFKEAESVKKALALDDLTLHGHKLLLSEKKNIFFDYAEIKAKKTIGSVVQSSEPTEKKKKTVLGEIDNLSEGAVKESSENGLSGMRTESLNSSLNEGKRMLRRKSKVDG